MTKKRLTSSQVLHKGGLLVTVLVFASIGILMLTGLVAWTGMNARVLRTATSRELAFHVAEAGIDYYRWHLAHAPTDYQDGTGVAGPYVHPFYDTAGNMVGNFSLTITAPVAGSTIVRVRSTGSTIAEPTITRKIEVLFAIPSFAKYAWVLNSFVNFGSTAYVYGPIHSNTGLRFDGIAYNLVTSATSTFDDPDHSGGYEFGVHTHDSPVDPLPPAAVPNRADVFVAGRQFPVPAVDFTGIISDLSQIKSAAQSEGRYFAASGGLGYHVVLKTNDTFDLYRVNTMYSKSGCSCSGTGCGTLSIKSGGETFLSNYTFPANGLIFVEDHMWVNGTIDGARLTIASAKFPDNPSTRTNINVTNDIRYTNYDGTDVIGLIAQGNFNVGLVSEDDLRVDAAIIAQNGRIGRYSYTSECSPNHLRTLLTTYGMLGTNQRSALWYGSNGYQTRNYIYDANLLYAPPPSFPLTADQYITISWEEVE
ncbi:MAG: hypothetical protein NUW02_01500 [Candidatus Campbellbacteria bacterium]|nr:hypothetical protein [Candidatus Campbellbacteria bacterium]